MTESDQPIPPSRELSDEALRWIVRLNSGDASREDREDYARWRERSPQHLVAATEAETIWGVAGNLHLDPATGLVRPGRRKADSVSRRTVVTGGIALIGTGAALLAYTGSQRPPADFSTATAETTIIDLPDGSRAHLNARSAINLAYGEAARDVELVEGQAYFEVAADPARPFQVHAAGLSVRALGTAFEVNRALPGEATAISVTEHEVLLTLSGNAAPQGVTLGEGQSVRVDGSGRLGSIVPVAGGDVASWRSGLYVAENRPLEEVVAALRPYQDGWIVIQSAQLAQLRVTAVLDLRQPRESLASLASALPLQVRSLTSFLTVVTEF